MDRSDEILKVLEEMRDIQRAHLEEYRSAAQKSMDLQQVAVARQKQATDIYKGALVAGAILTVIILGLVVYLMRFLF